MDVNKMAMQNNGVRLPVLGKALLIYVGISLSLLIFGNLEPMMISGHSLGSIIGLSIITQKSNRIWAALPMSLLVALGLVLARMHLFPSSVNPSHMISAENFWSIAGVIYHLGASLVIVKLLFESESKR